MRSYAVVSGTSSGNVFTKQSMNVPQKSFLLLTILAFVWVMTYEHRLENEHLNNVGKFRAFTSVPLPFNYGEEEESR